MNTGLWKVRPLNLSSLAVWAVLIASALTVSVFFSQWGYERYGAESFGPSHTATLVDIGISVSAALLLFVLAIIVTNKSRQQSLSGRRFKFLRVQGEDLLLAVIDYVDTVGLSGAESLALAKTSWNSAAKSVWPTRQVIQSVKRRVGLSSEPGSQQAVAVWASFERLRKAIQPVEEAAANSLV